MSVSLTGCGNQAAESSASGLARQVAANDPAAEPVRWGAKEPGEALALTLLREDERVTPTGGPGRAERAATADPAREPAEQTRGLAMTDNLPVGKLPPELMASLLGRAPCTDPRVLVGPGPGLDCAVVDAGGERLLVFKSDPITFVADDIGEYLVRINTNDIATTGAEPSWLLLTLLLPEGATPPERAEAISEQVFAACREAGIAVVGGHTEVTHGLDRPIAVGALVGEVARERLVTPRGARPGDRILITKGVPIEGTAILAGEFGERLADVLSAAELAEARAYLTDPGLDVLADVRCALGAGRVTAMHDPTEGGVATALWELAEACGHTLVVEPERIPVPDLARRVCAAFGLDPLATIASGALLLTCPPDAAGPIGTALSEAGIASRDIGEVVAGGPSVRRPEASGGGPIARPHGDAIGGIYAG